jgi:hypothetical protein
VFIAVYNKCVILLSKWVTLNAATYIYNVMNRTYGDRLWNGSREIENVGNEC